MGSLATMKVVRCEVWWFGSTRRCSSSQWCRAPNHSAKPNAFGFGSEPGLADELAELVLAGRKRATTSLAVEYAAHGLPLPKTGDLTVIVRGDGLPVAIIERTQVTTVAFESVDAAYAAVEGEGDGSLASWRAAHTTFFNAVCARFDQTFEAQTPVMCQIFRVIWR